MPTFVFKLDGVLRHRVRLEQQAQRVVAEKQAAVTGLQGELRQLNEDLQQSNDMLRREHLTGRIDLGYLSAHRRYTADVTRRGTLLMQKLAVAQRAVEEARAALAEAARQRKVLEKLREKQYERWRAEQSRRELAEADDVASRLSYAILREQEHPQESQEVAR